MSPLASPTYELSTYWRFIKNGREARCVLLPHPSGGLELRYLFNGSTLMGVVAPVEQELRERARQWRLRLVAEGWEETDHCRPERGRSERFGPAEMIRPAPSRRDEPGLDRLRADRLPADQLRSASVPSTSVSVRSGTRSHSGR